MEYDSHILDTKKMKAISKIKDPSVLSDQKQTYEFYSSFSDKLPVIKFKSQREIWGAIKKYEEGGLDIFYVLENSVKFRSRMPKTIDMNNISFLEKPKGCK